MTVTHKFETEVTNKYKFPKKLVAITVPFLVMLVLLEIWVSHSLVSFGEKYKDIEGLKRNLSEENQILENQIAMEGSLNKVASQSASLGLIKPSQVQYIR